MAHEVKMPQVSRTMLEATVATWLRQEGDVVHEGEPILQIETDKATVDVNATASGVLLRIVAPEGSTVEVGGTLALIAADQAEGRDEPAAAAPSLPPAVALQTKPKGQFAGASPAAREAAKELGVELTEVAGTGPDGIITRRDVETFAATARSGPDQAQTEWGTEESFPLAGIRKTISERLSLSRRTAADVTTVAEVEMTAVAVLKKTIEASYTAFVIRATVEGLKLFPMLNSSLIDNRIVVKKYFNIGISVAIPTGLVVPVIHNAERKTLRQIAEELASLSDGARRSSLGIPQLAGGTFTITNSGVFGSLLYTPIINYPESAVLGMGKIAPTPVVRGGEIVARSMMLLCLSYDHRVIDGEVAVRFLQEVKRNLEEPASLALE
ncbi:MAG: dihydrolipoamide acetyltransferase family protein [Chloroflexota bacterium]